MIKSPTTQNLIQPPRISTGNNQFNYTNPVIIKKN